MGGIVLIVGGLIVTGLMIAQKSASDGKSSAICGAGIRMVVDRRMPEVVTKRDVEREVGGRFSESYRCEATQVSLTKKEVVYEVINGSSESLWRVRVSK